MYDLDQKHYLFKFSCGKVLNLFYKDKYGICARTLDKRNQWSETEVLVKDCLPNFSACLDENDLVYLLYQNKYGNILEAYFANQSVVRSSPVLNCKSPNYYDKLLQIMRSNQTTYFFYMLKYSGKSLLTYQLKKDHDKVSAPRVIDSIEESKVPYKIAADTNGDFYILFNCNDSKHPGLGYKKLDCIKDHLSEFHPIKSLSYSSNIVSAFIDSKNTLHLCSQDTSGRLSKLTYTKIVSFDEESSESIILSNSTSPFFNASLMGFENKLLISWVNGNDIFCSISEDDGSTWSNQEKYSFYENKNLFCILYSSNFKSECENLYFAELPGNFIDGFNLAFLGDPSFKSEPEKVECSVTESSDHNSEHLFKIDELLNSISELRVKIENLEADYKRMESEFEKLKIYQGPCEDQNLQSPETNTRQEDAEKSRTPVMPGSGFSHITHEYLKSLKGNISIQHST